MKLYYIVLYTLPAQYIGPIKSKEEAIAINQTLYVNNMRGTIFEYRNKGVLPEAISPDNIQTLSGVQESQRN